MDKFNLQFATQKLRQETSTTSAGAGMTPSTVNNPVTQDWYTTKNKKKKPKKEGANIPKDFTDAPSIPNRPSKAFVYKQLYEELSKALKEEVSNTDFNHYTSALNDAYFELTRDGDIKGRDIVANAHKSLEHAEAAEEVINKSSITPGNKATYLKAIAGIKNYLPQPNKKNESLNKSIKEEYTETNLLNILDDIRTHIETSSALDTGFKEFALPLLNALDYNVQNEEWDDALLDLEDLNDSIKQVNRMEWEEVYNEMFEKAIHRVETLATEMEDDFYDDDDDSEFDDGPVTDYGKEKLNPGSYEKEYQRTGKTDFFRRHGGLDESYSKFKNQTKTRGKSDQFHQAIKEVKKKVLEINKMYEYVSRLKEELSEGEAGLEYKMHTEKALHKIKEMVSELNKKIKRFK